MAATEGAYNPHVLYEQIRQASDDVEGAAPAWEALLATLEKHDTTMAGVWKDELNNLLIFAGLFSAVVTAFTVESYTWLQQDPADVSVQLLAQISLQLSSFTVGFGCINATASPFHALDPAPFSPSTVAVNVNILWVMSLTLSLLASFFAIAVQQWLRHLPLPSRISMREAIRLQQSRYEGLMTWQVAGIVSLLPFLLQIAVIFFLGGLFLLLSSLNPRVALIFAVVAGTGIFAFLVMALIPLVSMRCPYKTPLVPTALALVQWCTYPLALAACLLGIVVDTICKTKPVETFLFKYDFWVTYRNLFHRKLVHLKKYIGEFGLHMYTDVNHFWSGLEMKSLLKRDPWSLDSSALSRGLMSARHENFRQIKRCLHDLSDADRIACLRGAVFGPPVKLEEESVAEFALGRSVPKALTHSGRLLSTRHEELAVAALPQSLVGSDSYYTRHDIAHFLIVLRFAVHSRDKCSRARQYYAHLLFNLRAGQKIEGGSWWWSGRQILIALLYEESDHYPFTREEALLAVSWAQKVLTLSNHPDAEWVFKYPWLHAASAVLASAATAFIALSAQQHLNSEDARRLSPLLQSLSHFLEQRKTSLLESAEQCRRNPEASILIVGPRAVTAICKSLADLTSREKLDCLLRRGKCAFQRLEVQLRDVCSGRDENAFVDGRRYLRQFRRQHASCSHDGH